MAKRTRLRKTAPYRLIVIDWKEGGREVHCTSLTPKAFMATYRENPDDRVVAVLPIRSQIGTEGRNLLQTLMKLESLMSETLITDLLSALATVSYRQGRQDGSAEARPQ